VATKATKADPTRLVAFLIVQGALVIGWFFILWQNKFHITVPVVMLCLGYLAVVLTVANLWRVGASAVAPEDATAEAWARPIGERDELEKEKKTLLKAIKEAEFDLAMGKLSKIDADQLITMYRTRAIAVIKETERLDGIAAAADKRGQIQREVAARLSLEGGSKKKKDKAAKAAAKAAAKEAAAKSAAAAKDAKPAKFAEPPKPGTDSDDADEDDDDDVDDADDAADAVSAASAAAKSADAKSDSKSVDVKAADVKAADVKAADVKAADVNAADVKAAEVKADATSDAKDAEKPATFAEPPKADDATKGASS
jgi:hypothetical protein